MRACLMLNMQDGSLHVQNEYFVETIVEIQVMVDAIDGK